MKYRKRPIIIEAFRFQIDDAMPDWFLDKMTTNKIVTNVDGTCYIHTLDKIMVADKGDYIIHGVQGEIYPCKPDVFRDIYEPIIQIPKLTILGQRKDEKEMISPLDNVNTEILKEAMREALSEKSTTVELFMDNNLVAKEVIKC